MPLFKLTPRGFRDVVRNLRRDIELFEVAVKRQRRQPTVETEKALHEARELLVETKMAGDCMLAPACRP